MFKNTRQPNKRSFLHLVSTLSLVILVTLSVAQMALAAMASVTVAPYTVDLVDYQVDQTAIPPSATAVYAVTVNSDIQNAISHVGFDLAAACDGAVDTVNQIYATLTSYVVGGSDVCNGTYNCYTDEWTIEIDNVSGGVKFECANGDCLKQGDNTLLFQMTVSPITNFTVPPTGSVNFEIKSPSDPATGTIAGPICEPTAVSLTSISASSSARSPLVIATLVMTAGAGSLSLATRKRR